MVAFAASLPTRPVAQRAFLATSMRSSAGAVEWLNAAVVVRGPVARGFGRGSRDLGTPTANLPGTLLDGMAATERNGVYVGFGMVPKYGGVMKMVANIGMNVTYGDVENRVLEAFLMDDEGRLAKEFYGEEMRLCLVGYLRPELKFDSVGELMENIQNDVSVAAAVLDAPEATPFKEHDMFKSSDASFS